MENSRTMKETEQQTLGNTRFRDCSHNNAECGKIVEGESCPNNAVVAITDSNNRIVYRCGVHARNFALRKINYNE